MEKEMNIPRPEYPRPQFERKNWINLNGIWSYEFDFGKSGIEREIFKTNGFANSITVPFVPESRLSGVEYTDFIENMFYHRKITIPSDWSNRRIILNFGAVDFIAEIFINGKKLFRHVGGSTPFAVDITNEVKPGNEYDLVVGVTDLLRSFTQGAGKQSPEYHSHNCVYTRSTGIWQTVDLEACGMYGIKSCRITPDFDGGRFIFTPQFYAVKNGYTFEVKIYDGNTCCAEKSCAAISGTSIDITLDNPKSWSPESPFLYDIVFTVKDAQGNIDDEVYSYAGLRKIHVEGNKMFLNNKELYLRQVLDQGFWPDSLWTAPCDDELKNDILRAMRCGFNGARLHQKVFEPRYHYYADKLGYLTWGEFPTWGLSCTRDLRYGDKNYFESVVNHLREWACVIERDYNHPSIISWVPQNETHPIADKIIRYSDYITTVYDFTKQLDPTRPVNESSGWDHIKTDLWTIHCYVPTVDQLAERLQKDKITGKEFKRHHEKNEVEYDGQPCLVDEFGGFKFIPVDRRDPNDTSWGYGGLILEKEEDLLERIRPQVELMNNDERLSGYTYTQLTDVEQEKNGLYTYDRVPKCKEEDYAAIFGQTPERLKAED